MTALTKIDTPDLESPDNLFDAALLRAVAALADARGDVAFTPGGGMIFDKPLSRSERAALPEPAAARPRLLALPEDRFHAALDRDPSFRAFVETFTIERADPGYRLVALPLPARLSGAELRAIALAAESFGHGRVRITPKVTIRFTHVPTALLRPLFRSLELVGLLAQPQVRRAA
jgi:hypothetical protein